MRRRGVAAAAQDRDLELIHRRHHRSRHDAHGADRKVVPEVNAKRGVDPRRFEYTVADHRLRTIRRFFGRLEREFDAAAEL